jgi:carbon storage regulator
MLVLSRRPGEEIMIGDNIRLTILSIRGMQIRLGVSAPAEVSVYRSELSESERVFDRPAGRPSTLEESS